MEAVNFGNLENKIAMKQLFLSGLFLLLLFAGCSKKDGNQPTEPEPPAQPDTTAASPGLQTRNYHLTHLLHYKAGCCPTPWRSPTTDSLIDEFATVLVQEADTPNYIVFGNDTIYASTEVSGTRYHYAHYPPTGYRFIRTTEDSLIIITEYHYVSNMKSETKVGYRIP